MRKEGRKERKLYAFNAVRIEAERVGLVLSHLRFDPHGVEHVQLGLFTGVATDVHPAHAGITRTTRKGSGPLRRM